MKSSQKRLLCYCEHYRCRMMQEVGDEIMLTSPLQVLESRNVVLQRENATLYERLGRVEATPCHTMYGLYIT